MQGKCTINRRLKTLLLISSLLGSLDIQTLPQPLNSVAYPQEVYLAEDFRYYAPQTLFDLLQRLPGVSLGWQPDGELEIQLHGLSSQYLTLLINGHPLLGGAGNSSLNTRQIPASLIHHIEIDRNSRADLDAGGGAAGTINVVLHNAYGDNRLQLSGGGGALNAQLAASAQLLSGESPLRLSAERRLARQDSSGFSRTADDSGDWREHRRELSRSLLLSFDTLLNNRHPLHLYALYLQADNDDQLQGLHPLNSPSSQQTPQLTDSRTERDSERVTLRSGGNLRLNWQHLSLDAFFVAEQFDQDIRLSHDQPLTTTQTNQIDDSRYRLGWQLNETLNEHRWSIGLSMQQMKRINNSLSNAILTSNSDRRGLPYNFDYKENRLSAFVLDRWQLTPNTLFEAGVHMSTYELSQDSYVAEGDSGISTDTHWLPSFHLLHHLDSKRRVRLSMSQNTREPEITDRIPHEFRQSNTIWRGNGELEAELVSNIDIGYEHNFRASSSSRADRHSGLYLRAFQRIINQAILQTSRREKDTDGITELNVLQPQNSSGNAILRGAELDIELPLDDRRFSLELGAGVYRSDVQASTELPYRHRLPNQPDYMARIGLQQRINDTWRHGICWRVQGGSKQILPAPLSTDGYTSQSTSAAQNLDIYTEYQWNRRWRGLATLNLTPGASPFVRQDGIRQYQDLEPLWYLTIQGQF